MSGVAAETELRGLEEQMTAIEREHGLAEDEFWLPEEAPAEYERLRQQQQEAWNDIFVRLLEHFGEHEAAELFRQDHDEFERRTEAGREYFHGPLFGEDAPDWLDEFLTVVADQMTADSPTGPLKFRYIEDEGLWDVVVHPTPVELVGGAQDGEVVATGFSLDLEGLRAAFDSVTAMGWGKSPSGMPFQVQYWDERVATDVVCIYISQCQWELRNSQARTKGHYVGPHF